MADYYFDSSAVVKKYVVETGTGWVFKLIRPSSFNTVFISRLTSVDVISAITRRLLAGQIAQLAAQRSIVRLERDLQKRFSLLRPTDRVVSAAMRIARDYGVRAYDAVQLATAIELSSRSRRMRMPGPIFVSADRRLNQVAQLVGLTVEDPNTNP